MGAAGHCCVRGSWAMSGVMQDEEKSPKWGANHCQKNGNLKIQKPKANIQGESIGKRGNEPKKNGGLSSTLGNGGRKN